MTSYALPDKTFPAGITTGPDGALWFANCCANSIGSIGRITTAGQITFYSGTDIHTPEGITAGPDGALWFADGDSIGRITTSGVVTEYDELSIGPWAITSGSNGALWFTNYAGPPAIGRVTTAGAVTISRTRTNCFPTPQVSRSRIPLRAGPDGALWFVNKGNDTVGQSCRRRHLLCSGQRSFVRRAGF